MTSESQETVFSGWSVLVIDDEPDSLRIAELLLKRYGAQVLTALNGHEGLLAAQIHLPQLIIADLSMPGMDGWQMLAALQQDTRLRTIPVVALTAHAMHGDRERTLAAGFRSYLTKPLKPRTFLQDFLLVLQDIPELSTLLKGN
ncbi:MAG: response regulator [Chloroflexi bacterium]|nr:response regulator [Chloroflexota bacterium]